MLLLSEISSWLHHQPIYRYFRCRS